MLLKHYKVVDLTQPLFEDVPTWGGGCGFCLEIKKDYAMFRNDYIQMEAGVGTHMDAPSHLFRGATSIDNIPLDQLIIQACLIDVSEKADPDYEISVEDVKDYEQRHGLIPKGSIVIGYTGWNRFWRDAAAYRNLDSNEKMHFPAFSAEAAQALLERDICGIAIDTLSPDCYDKNYSVHRLILGAGKYIIENIGDCSQIPPKGAYLIALPLKIEGGTECPMRIVGLVPNIDIDT
jgi:kynurenine formamidase